MDYNLLGDTGVFVSELSFGTMSFGGEGMWKSVGEQQQAEADELLKMAIESGVNFIDTANVYSFGQSETILGNSIDNLNLNLDELFIGHSGGFKTLHFQCRTVVLRQVNNLVSLRLWQNQCAKEATRRHV